MAAITCMGRHFAFYLRCYIKVASAGTRHYGLVTRNWERKRFYKHSSVYQSSQGNYGVKLDHRQLKTPLRNPFLLPSKDLAIAVAQEWNDQRDIIQPSLMHLTSLCNTAIDKPVYKEPEERIKDLFPYLETDVLRCVDGESDEFARIQETTIDPHLNWFNKQFGTNISRSSTLIPPSLTDKEKTIFSNYLSNLNLWQLTGFSYGVECSKSFIATVLLFEEVVTPCEATQLALLESNFQTKRWGTVEWAHGVELEDVMCRLSAAKLIFLLHE